MTDQPLSLDDIRLRLNDIDNRLLQLLSERRQLSIEVAKSKVETAKPVRDPIREQQLLVKLINTGNSNISLMPNISLSYFTPSLKTQFCSSRLICKT